MRISKEDRIDLEQEVRRFTDVIRDMKARLIRPDPSQRIADYEQIVFEINKALAVRLPMRLH
jgi:hypothetical protein